MGVEHNNAVVCSKGYLIIWACLLVYLGAPATANMHNEHYSDDPCSPHLLRMTTHGVITVNEFCNSTENISEDVTYKIIKSLPELTSYRYSVIVCPTAVASIQQCLYSVYIMDGIMILPVARLTIASVAVLHSEFNKVTLLEPENVIKISQSHHSVRRESNETGSGSGLESGSGSGSGVSISPTSPTSSMSPTSSTSPTSSNSPTDRSHDLSGLKEWHIGVITFAGLSVLLCIALTIMVMFFLRKRKLKKLPSLPLMFDNENFELHPITPQLPKKISRLSFRQLITPVQTNMLDMNTLKELLSNYNFIEDEFSNLPRNMTTTEHIPAGVEQKNRYIDILPNPRTRVALYLQNGIANSDYINANYIRGYKMTTKQYIAAQGPLPSTVEDFWRMVWEQGSSTIVMLTNFVENERIKCHRYWPDERVNRTLVFGDLIVTVGNIEAKSNYLITSLYIQHKDKAVTREVNHFWFTSWPDHGVPDATTPVIAFVRAVRKHQTEIPGPLVVHCSAGIGRTGVFIASDIGMRQLEDTNKVDIVKIVSMLRQDRGGMVQTVAQYHFVYKLLYEYGGYLQQISSSHLLQQHQQQEQQLLLNEDPSNDSSADTTEDTNSQASLII